MKTSLKPADEIEIVTLQDNYIDITANDDSAVIHRAKPLKEKEMRASILAEHGFSSMISVTSGDQTRSMILDFGFSEFGAARNANLLGVDFSTVEIMALSHGHSDHTGGLETLVKAVNKKKIPFVYHPDIRNPNRYVRTSSKSKLRFPEIDDKILQKLQLDSLESEDPLYLMDDQILFLGEIPRKTDFERIGKGFIFVENGEERTDTLRDDTAIVANLKGKGLVVVSGCAHSGIINTVKHAKKVTGIDKVHVIMGGFHLNGADMNKVVQPTIEGLLAIDPDYLVPTHCTGRKTINELEKAMPDKFILNMSGTKLVFQS